MDVKRLESWFMSHQRDLPFRKTTDPYLIWVSEIMLQQTQVDSVIPYYEKFAIKYPTVHHLAKADEEVLKKDLEGIGYYRRFSLMQKAAKVIVETYDGIFPKTYEEVKSLPGVGLYTAGAIMSIAYHKPYSAVDGNVIRVLSRYLGLYDDFRLDKHKKTLNDINQKFMEHSEPHLYTPALIELGALVCRPKNPKCHACPLQNDCFAYHHQEIQSLPFLSKLKAKEETSYITLVIREGTSIYLKKQEDSLLQGMYLYPQYPAESIEYVTSLLEDQSIIFSQIKHLKAYKHIFTHKVWWMDVYEVKLKSGIDPTWVKVSLEELKERPMGIAHRKIKI